MDPQAIDCEDDADAEFSFDDDECGSKLLSVAAKACSDEFSSSPICPLGLLTRESMVKSTHLRITEELADFCSILLSNSFIPLGLLSQETILQLTSSSQEEGIPDFCSTEDLDLLTKLEIGIEEDKMKISKEDGRKSYDQI